MAEAKISSPSLADVVTVPTLFAAVAGAAIGFWVLFFPKCTIEHPVTTCSWLGLDVQCLPSIDLTSPYNFRTLHWILFFVLIGIGAYNFTKYNPKRSYNIMTLTTAFYATITAFFALFRAQYGIGKPLLVGAALHNLSEWSYVAHISQSKWESRKKYLIASAAWIFFIVLICIVIPDIKLAIIVEQAFGIMLDFTLVIAFIEQATYAEDAEVRKFYLNPAVSVFVHLFFTILPLVYANFSVGDTNFFTLVNEFDIYISAVITHVLYLIWGQRYDDKVATSEHFTLPEKFVVKGMRIKIVIGFGLGLIPLLGIVAHAPVCPAPTLITGTTIANVHPGLGDAFSDRIQDLDLVAKARAAPGNVNYNFYRNIMAPNEFRFIETWENKDVLNNWVQGYPKKVFSDPAVTSLLVGGAVTIQGGYLVVQTAPKPLHNGGLHFDLGSTCEKIWPIISNWSDCTLVIGCTQITLDPKDPSKRRVHVGPSRSFTEQLVDLDNADKSLKYSLLTPTGYNGTIVLRPNKETGGCSANYAFAVDGINFQVNNVYDDFLKNRIPALQKIFAK